MPAARSAPADLDQARREVDTVTACLREGFPPISPAGCTTTKSAVRVAADRLGVDRRSLAERIGTPERPGSHARRFGLSPDWQADEKAAAERGELGYDPILPGFALQSTSTQRGADGNVEREWIRQGKAPGAPAEVPAGHILKGVSILADASGREIQRWIKTREGLAPQATVAEVRKALAEMPERAEPAPRPAHSLADLATVYPLADLHLGLLTWQGEVGENWDLTIARQTIAENVARLIDAAPASRQAVILGLGDLLHADGYDNATPKSKNVLDCDGRYPRILGVAVRLLIETVRQALRKHDQVLVRVLPGNHDPESTVAVNLALDLYYESDDRVTVDASASPFWWWEWGVNFLGATHGDGAKMKDLPIIMATANPEAWGRSKVREVMTGHIHNESKIDIRGVAVESFRTPIPADSWHHRMGYGGGRSLSAITYHRARGRTQRNDVMILPPGEADEMRMAA